MLFAWPHSTLHCQTQQKQAQILGSLQGFSIFCNPMLVSMLFILSSSSSSLLLFLSFFLSFFRSFFLSFFLSSFFLSFFLSSSFLFFLSVFLYLFFPVLFFLYSSCLLILYLFVSFLLLFPFNTRITHTFNKPQRLPKTGHTKQLLSGRNFSIFCIPMLFAWPLSTWHCQTQQKQAQILGSLQVFCCLYRYAAFFVFFFLLLLLLYLCLSFLLILPFNQCIAHTFNKPQRLLKTGHASQLLSLSGHSCRKLLWDTLKPLWDTLVGHSCRTLL